MIVLVCGGRDFNNRELFDRAMAEIARPSLIIHGGAAGADSMADQWAAARGIHRARVDAIWRVYGKAAGYRRNESMLLLNPSLCVAMPGGRGTQNMVDLCLSAGVRVWRPYG